jgi:hypothetical protein
MPVPRVAKHFSLKFWSETVLQAREFRNESAQAAFQKRRLPMTIRKKPATTKSKKSKKKKTKKKKKAKRWSGKVTRESHALALEDGVFTKDDPKKIARSLKRSADKSDQRKAGAYRSALSMLTFYINRAGKNLPASRKKKLNQAKTDLKKLFDRG